MMLASLEAGFANSIGFEEYPEAVTATATACRRRLRSSQSRRLEEGNTTIEFTVRSIAQDESSLQTLVSDIETAAVEGAVVANIQSEAAANNVLTAELQAATTSLRASKRGAAFCTPAVPSGSIPPVWESYIPPTG